MQISLVGEEERGFGKQQEPRMNGVRPGKLQTSKQLAAIARWAECKTVGKNILIRSYSAACAHNHTLYVYGGLQILNGMLSDFHQIDLNEDADKFEWRDVHLADDKATPGKRAKHAMVCYDECLYLIGGLKGSAEDSNEIDRFSIKEALWSKLEPTGAVLPTIDSFGCVLVGSKIFLICGCDGKTCQSLNSVYEYDIGSNKLTLLFGNQPSKTNGSTQDYLVPTPRSNCSAAHVDGRIFIFGGKIEGKRTNDLWAFDLKTNLYQHIKQQAGEPPIARSGHTLTSYHDNIYLFGGIHQVTWELDDLNIYDPKVMIVSSQTNSWHTIDIDSPRFKKNQRQEAEAKQLERKLSIKKKEGFGETVTSLPHQPAYRRSDSMTQNDNLAKYLHLTREASDINIAVSPGKMIGEQRKKAFMQKKANMLKDFEVNEKEKGRYINVEPVSQAMRNSLDIIGNPNPKPSNPPANHSPTNGDRANKSEMGRTTCSRFLEPLVNNVSMIPNKKPCARDGHNAVLMGDALIILGGDRHQMSFNDIFRLNLSVLRNELQK